MTIGDIEVHGDDTFAYITIDGRGIALDETEAALIAGYLQGWVERAG